MENYTYNSNLLLLEGLQVTQESMYPVFLFFLSSYIFIMASNIGIVVLIFIERALHQPMYFLFCNLSLNDIIGNSITIPRLLIDFWAPSSGHYITYAECVVQAFATHIYGTTSHTILMIMAFDRYVAICNPLRYTTIMSTRMVVKLTVSAWGAAFLLVAILLGLTLRLNRCRTFISNPYCDNASLFKLSCEDVSINNIYGLSFTVVLFTSSIGSVLVTYTKITAVCLINQNKSLNSKAFRTCATHLVIYLVMLWCSFVIIILHRFPEYSYYRKIAALLFHVIPGSLNPVIYGVQCKEIRKYIFTSRKISAVF